MVKSCLSAYKGSETIAVNDRIRDDIVEAFLEKLLKVDETIQSSEEETTIGIYSGLVCSQLNWLAFYNPAILQYEVHSLSLRTCTRQVMDRPQVD